MGLLDLTRIGRPGLSRWPWRSPLLPPARGRADRHQVLARLETRRPGGAVPGRARQGLLQGRRPRRHHRRRGRLARADHPRRSRHLRHGLRRHQLADQVPRPIRRRRSRPCSWSTTSRLLDRRPQEPRRHRAEGARGQEARRAAAGATFAQWPIFAKLNNIDASKVTIENIGFPVREPMLAAGQVDAAPAFRSGSTSI